MNDIMRVTVTEKLSGKTVATMNADTFMQVAKENFGIGRNASLMDYIARYNEVKCNEVASIQVK